MSGSYPARTVTAQPGLRSQAATGVLWSIAASGAQQAVSLLIFAILARQLSPLEFGVMGMATIFVEILNLIGRGGLVEVLIQRRELGDTESSTAFWSSLALGLLGTGVLWGTAGLIGAFFKVPELVDALRWLALVPTINSVATVHEALLRRAFGFRALALRAFAVTLVSGVVAVSMAASGFGVTSLIAQSLVGAVLSTAVMWSCARWWPTLAFSAGEFVRQIRMGMTLCVSTLLGMGNQRIVDLVVGHLLGPVPLGFLRVAWRGFDTMLDVSMRPVVQVTLPVFSRLQGDLPSLAAAYVHLARLTAVLIYPVFIGATLVAPEIILLAFGHQWEASVPLVQILSLSVLSMPMIYYKSNVLVAVGHARPVFWLNVLEFGLSLGLVALFCRFGVAGAAWGNVLRVILVAPPIFWALRRFVGIAWKPLLAAMGPATVCTSLMAAAVLGVRMVLASSTSPAVMLLAGVGTGMAAYAASLRLLYRPLFDELAALAPRPLRRLLGPVGA